MKNIFRYKHDISQEEEEKNGGVNPTPIVWPQSRCALRVIRFDPDHPNPSGYDNMLRIMQTIFSSILWWLKVLAYLCLLQYREAKRRGVL